MKKIIFLIPMFFCLVAKAQVNVVANFASFQFAAITNQQLTIATYSVPSANQSSVIIGSSLVTNTGNGTVTNLLQNNFLYNYVVRDPVYNKLIGQFWIFPTNASGTINAQNCLVANGYTTFPAGSVAWAAATSDLRYAPISAAITNSVLLSGTNVFTGPSNVFNNPLYAGTSITLNGATITTWPAGVNYTSITNINGLSNGLLNIQVSTNVGTNVWVSTSGSNITINLPQAATATNGILNSNDWNTFNGKQNALGFTPVPNTRNVSTSSPLAGGGALSGDLTLSIPAASASQNGYLSSADWSTFNGKASANGTLATTSPLTGGGNLSNNLTVSIPVATGLAAGYLTNTDWVTFNNKQSALAVSAPITLTGSNLAVTQSGTAANGYLSSADWNTFNGRQAGSVALSNFASLGTNYYQATNANLTTLANSNGGFLTNLTATNLVGNVNTNNLTNSIFAMLAAGANVTFTTNNDTITIASSGGGGGSGIGTNGGIGYGNNLITPMMSNAVATNAFTVSKNGNGASAVNGLFLSNSTAATAILNQGSPAIALVGNGWDSGGDTSDKKIIQILNSPQTGSPPYAQLNIIDPDLGQILSADQINGFDLKTDLIVENGGIIEFRPFTGGGNKITYLDNSGEMNIGSTTDILPEGSANLYFTTNRVQSVGDIRYQRKGIKTVTGNYTLTTNDYDIICDTTSGNISITLVNASFTTNVYVFKNIGANVLTVNTTGVDLIEGFSHFTNAINGQSDLFQSDGGNPGNWRHIATFVPTNSLNQTFIGARNGFGTNTTLVNPTLTSTNGGQEVTIIGSVANQNSERVYQLDTSTGYGAISFGSYHANGTFTELGAVGVSMTNSAFYSSAPFMPGFLYMETDSSGSGIGWVNNNLPLAYIDTNLAQFHIATNGGAADVAFFNRQNGNGGIFGNWGAQSITDSGGITVAGVQTNQTNLIVGGILTVTNAATFGSNTAQITTKGFFQSNPSNSVLNGNFVAGAAFNAFGSGGANSAIVGGIFNTSLGGGSETQDGIVAGTSNVIQATTGGTLSNSVIVGGISNTISSDTTSSPGPQGDVILGGGSNVVNKGNSIAGGINAIVTNAQTFVWNSSNLTFNSTSNGQFLINATNGVGINVNNPGTNALLVNGPMAITNMVIQTGTAYPFGTPQIYSNGVNVAGISTNGHLSVDVSGTNLLSIHAVGNTNSGIMFDAANTNDIVITSKSTNVARFNTNGLQVTNLADFSLTNGAAMSNGTFYIGLGSGYGANFGGGGHTVDNYEAGITSAGGAVIQGGFDQQANADIQIGGSGHYHIPTVFQYDSSGLTNLAGWSSSVLFADIVSGTNHYFGLTLQAQNTNTGESRLEIYPHWNGSTNYTYSGAQVDPLGPKLGGWIDSTNIQYGSFTATNSLVVGSNNPSGNFTFEVQDPSDAGETLGLFRVDSVNDSVVIGRASSTGGKHTNFRVRTHDGFDFFVCDPLNNRVFVAQGVSLAVNKSSPSFPLDVSGIINSSSNIQSGVAGGFVTYNTNQYPVAATGWTNTNSFNCTLYITSATAATFTFSDGTNNIFTDTGLTFTTAETIGMGPSYKVTVSSGTITGVAIASH